MGLKINKADVPEGGFDADGEKVEAGGLTTKMVFGKTMSMVYAVRPEGHRGVPHAHDAEQFNYVEQGKIWIFVEDEVVLLEPGDFNRIPSMAVHWAIVEEGPCVMIESHSPPYIGDKELAGPNKEKVVGLFRDSEEPAAMGEAVNIWARDSYAEHEEQMMEEHLDT